MNRQKQSKGISKYFSSLLSKMSLITFVLAFMFINLALAASATCYNNVRIESVGLNTNVSINSTVCADFLDIKDSYIYFENLTPSGLDNITYNLNITDLNYNYAINSTNISFPYISIDNSNFIQVKNNYAYQVNASINTYCSPVNQYTFSNTSTATCSGNRLTGTIYIPASGTFNISISNNNRHSLAICENIYGYIVAPVVFLGVIITIMSLVVMLAMLNKYEVKSAFLIGGVVILFICGMLVMVEVIAVNTMCGL